MRDRRRKTEAAREIENFLPSTWRGTEAARRAEMMAITLEFHGLDVGRRSVLPDRGAEGKRAIDTSFVSSSVLGILSEGGAWADPLSRIGRAAEIHRIRGAPHNPTQVQLYAGAKFQPDSERRLQTAPNISYA